MCSNKSSKDKNNNSDPLIKITFGSKGEPNIHKLNK